MSRRCILIGIFVVIVSVFGDRGVAHARTVYLQCVGGNEGFYRASIAINYDAGTVTYSLRQISGGVWTVPAQISDESITWHIGKSGFELHRYTGRLRLFGPLRGFAQCHVSGPPKERQMF